MLALAATVLFASFLGSMHCVGMCGPFALWLSDSRQRRASITAYHLGRLTTFLSAGLVAGVLGSAVSIGGNFAGFQSLAARFAGLLLIGAGLWRLLSPLMNRGDGSALELPQPTWIVRLLQHAKPVLNSRGPLGRAYLGGLLTTWLPCGWLYLFVLVAAGTANVPSAMVVMFAFWIGTLPALTVLVVGTQSLLPRLRAWLPAIAGVLLIAFGLYTATGRASADLSTMLPGRPRARRSSADVALLRNRPLVFSSVWLRVWERLRSG